MKVVVFMNSIKGKKWPLIFSIASILIIAAVWLIIDNTLLNSLLKDPPNQLTVTVAWNPGSIIDSMIHTMALDMDSQLTLQYIPGENGARGKNAVFQAAHDGANILATNMSAFVATEAMGFAESSPRDWTVWLCAFSPSVVTVSADSSYESIGDLITDLRQNPGRLRCANAGFGTISYVAAELFSTRSVLEFDHIYYPGDSPVIQALLDKEADFAILQSDELVNRLRSGELKALCVFSEEELDLSGEGSEIVIPTLKGSCENLDMILPFGEIYGLPVPADVPINRIHGIETLVKSAVETVGFASFVNGKGLVAIEPDYNKNIETIEHLSSLICWTLYDVGFLPINPSSLDIGKIACINEVNQNNA